MANLKSIGQNAILYGMGNACLRLASFLLTPLYTYSLSMNDYGLLMTLFVTIQVLVILTGLGTPTGFMRFAGECDKRNELGHLLVSTVLLQALSCLAFTGLLVVFLQPLFRHLLHANEVAVYLMLAGAVALSQSLFENAIALFRLQGDGRRFILACVCLFGSLIVLTTLLVRVFHYGIVGALVSQVCTYGSLWLVLMVSRIHRIRIGLSQAIAKMLFKFSFPLVFSSASSMLADVSSIYFLSYFVSLEQVSIFSLALKIASMAGVVLILPFQLSYEPFVYRNIHSPGIGLTISRIYGYLLVAFAFTAFGIAFVFRDLMRLIAPPAYYEAYRLVFFLLPALAFRCTYYIGESLAGIKKKTKQIGGIVTAINLTSIAVNYYLVQVWGIWGAVLMFNMTMAAAGIGLLLLGLAYHPIPMNWRRISLAFGLLAVFLATVFGLRSQPSLVFYSFTPLLIIGLGGGGLYRWFCTDQERALICSFLQDMRGRVQASYRKG